MRERLDRRTEKTVVVSAATGAGSVIAGGVVGGTVSAEAGIVLMNLGIFSPIIGAAVELVRRRRDRKDESNANQNIQVPLGMPTPVFISGERRDPTPLISAAFSGNLERSPDLMELFGQDIQDQKLNR